MAGVYTVAVLTVSDTSSKDKDTDKTGPLLAELFESTENFKVVERDVVPDEEPAIRSCLERWSSSRRISLCITTGGTGFSPRDLTPEAVRPLLVKEASGLQHLMMSTSLSKTPMAALSRPVAGVTKDGMVICTVPGSPKGAKENVEALLPIIPHALDLCRGGSGKSVHASMGMPERQTGSSLSSEQLQTPPHDHSQGHRHSHSHHHHHHHHHHGDRHAHAHGHQAPVPRTVRSMDLAKGVSGRHRMSQYPIIPLEEAYALIFENTPVLETSIEPVTENLTGKILAEDVYSTMDLPSTMTTNVDGYAVKAEETPAGTYPVLTTQDYAGKSILETPLPDKHIFRINTGGPLPLGADAVIMVEDTELASSYSSADGCNGKKLGEEKEVTLLAKVDKGENVRMPGSDVKKGEKVLDKGTRISAVGGEIGTLAFVGKKEVAVHRLPKVAIMSTGNEITGLHDAPHPSSPNSPGQPTIYDSNRPSLHAALKASGFAVHDLGIVADDEQAHVAALAIGKKEADVVITTGGTSMGESDLLKPVIERNFGGTVHFGRVAMKPGKPTTFATLPVDKEDEMHKNPTIVFALPGNPASALVTYHLFVLPCLRKMSGYPDPSHWHLPRVKVKATSSMRLDPRPEFHRVWIQPTNDPPFLVAKSTGGQRSSRTVSLASANGLVCLPSSKGTEIKEVKEGEVVDAILIGTLL